MFLLSTLLKRERFFFFFLFFFWRFCCFLPTQHSQDLQATCICLYKANIVCYRVLSEVHTVKICFLKKDQLSVVSLTLQILNWPPSYSQPFFNMFWDFNLFSLAENQYQHVHAMFQSHQKHVNNQYLK